MLAKPDAIREIIDNNVDQFIHAICINDEILVVPDHLRNLLNEPRTGYVYHELDFLEISRPSWPLAGALPF